MLLKITFDSNVSVINYKNVSKNYALYYCKKMMILADMFKINDRKIKIKSDTPNIIHITFEMACIVHISRHIPMVKRK